MLILHRRGLCFAVFEGPRRLVAWGCMGAAKLKPKLVRRATEKLIDEYEPDFVVLEASHGSRRGHRARRAIGIVREESLDYGAGVRMVSRTGVREAFATTGFTKHEIAQAIAKRFPELARLLPPPRQLWRSEPERMNVFDAASFALTALPDVERGRVDTA